MNANTFDRWADSVFRSHPTAIRASVDAVSGGVLGGGPDRYLVLIWPSALVVHTGSSRADADERCSALSKRLRKARLYATRPFGTCPRCSEPLVDEARTCANCGVVVPAGPRVSEEEAAARRPVNVDRWRGRAYDPEEDEDMLNRNLTDPFGRDGLS